MQLPVDRAALALAAREAAAARAPPAPEPPGHPVAQAVRGALDIEALGDAVMPRRSLSARARGRRG